MGSTATTFFATGFFATGFFAAGFFAADFFAAGFFAAGFFAVGFFAVGFFAAGFFFTDLVLLVGIVDPQTIRFVDSHGLYSQHASNAGFVIETKQGDALTACVAQKSQTPQPDHPQSVLAFFPAFGQYHCPCHDS
ncbi:MAG: hypothetical protein L3K26_07575 [Candidatus Hydrogenedentes bacterium]|nr:hypothetical protein [Candidatus Hydrogenedentota bacterium]